MRSIETVRTYLQMLEAPRTRLAPPQEPVAVAHLARPTLAQYRFLYNSVGRDYSWVDRNLMADEALRQILESDLVDVYRLLVQDRIAGFAELDRRGAQGIELAYFGLFPGFLGKGLGRYFLNWVLHKAWEYAPDRVWLHTCTLDHPAALPTYLKAGFEIYDRQRIRQALSPEPPAP